MWLGIGLLMLLLGFGVLCVFADLAYTSWSSKSWGSRRFAPVEPPPATPTHLPYRTPAQLAFPFARSESPCVAAQVEARKLKEQRVRAKQAQRELENREPVDAFDAECKAFNEMMDYEGVPCARGAFGSSPDEDDSWPPPPPRRLGKL